MAGPYTGTWRQAATSLAEYTGAAKWGTGVNPIHSIEGAGEAVRQEGTKLNIYPLSTPGGQDTDTLAEDYSWDPAWNPDPFLPTYDTTDPTLYGYNSETGTADRPSWGSEMADSTSPPGLPNPQFAGAPVTVTRGSIQNDTGNPYPSWGGSRKTGPAGRMIRAIRRGSQMITAARVLPDEAVDQGWTNKAHGIAADSRPADDTQVFMQTSMTQRYKTRAGSQRSGSQSEHTAPIDSRVTGQKVKNWTTPQSSRHWDMLPYEQVDFARPFLSRQAGTGYREWQYPNEMYVSPTIQREPSPDPEMGPVAGSGGDNDATFGYSYEDGGQYY
jgi:hypothetical protein